MKVLMVDQFGEMGGAQKCLLDLIDGWPEGDALVVAAPADGTLLRSVGDRGLAALPIASGPYGMGAKAPRDVLRFFTDLLRQRDALRQIVRRFGIDVVYVNGPRVLAGTILAARGCCPVIYHAHNRLRRRSEIALVRFALTVGSSASIACCEHVSGTPGSMVIRNGVADAGYRERSYPPAEDLWRIGIVGRISPEKGHLILLNAVRMLAAEGHRIQLTVAGASLFAAGECEADLRQRCAGLDVRFTGWVDDVGQLLGDFDLLAVPSTAEPGLPRVVLEGFSAGVPVVAVASGGIAEAVRDNITGFLTSAPTAEALAARLRKVMQGPPRELVRVGKNARREWERYWNVDRWRREVIAAIRATAMGRDAARPAALAASGAASGDHRSASA